MTTALAEAEVRSANPKILLRVGGKSKKMTEAASFLAFLVKLKNLHKEV